MPSGYTSDIHDNKPVTFEQFALNCARGMGAAIHQRDDGAGEITERKLDSWYVKNVSKSRGVLIEMEERSMDEWAALQDAEIREAQTYRDNYVLERDALRGRYESMLEAVNAWEPPTTEHQGLKDFMREQLEGSAHFDCGPCAPSVPEVVSVEVYKARQIAAQRDRLARELESLEKEQERVRSQNEWVRALRESLRED